MTDNSLVRFCFLTAGVSHNPTTTNAKIIVILNSFFLKRRFSSRRIKAVDATRKAVSAFVCFVQVGQSYGGQRHRKGRFRFVLFLQEGQS